VGWLVLVCIAVAISSVIALGQAASGTITGLVTDPSGAVVPGASVIATDTATGVQTGAVTNAAGYYEAIDLQPGPYTLQIEANGFKKMVRSGIVVQVADRLGIDLKLEIGSVSETVSVTAQAPLVHTEDTQTGEVINYKMIQDLPQYGRDALQLVALAGNVQGDGSRAGGGSDTRVNGGRTSGIDYLVDGVSVVIGQAHTVNSSAPALDDVEEFKVLTNGATADVGRVSGGSVELVTKGGTNNLHGQLYSYYQDQIFDDSGWVQKANGGTKTPYHRNDFGAAVGGPVDLPHLYHGRNKTFFFATYEGVREAQAGSLILSQVPTAAERTGDMSGTFLPGSNGPVYPHMYQPCYSAGDCSSAPVLAAPNAGDPGNPGGMEYQKYNLLGGDGMHVPSGMISKVSAAILKNMPLPNHTPISGTSDSGNYVGMQNVTDSTDTWSVRIDQAFTDKSRMYGRFTHSQALNDASSWSGPLNPSYVSSTPGGWGLSFHYDYAFSPTLSLTLTAGGYFNPSTTGSTIGVNTSDFGFDSVNQSFLNGNMLYNAVDFEWNAGTNATYFGGSAQELRFNSTTGQFGGSLTKVLKHHTLQFGAESRHYYDDSYISGGGSSVFIGDPVTEYSYDAGDGSLYSGVNGLGAFELGLNDLMDVSSYFDRELAQNYYAGYGEDSYKVTPRLTLSLGLRWDMESPVTERHDRLYFWDSNAPTQFSIASGWSWDTALATAGLTPDQIQQVQTPDWVTNGFPKGAIRIANTPEHPSRFGTPYHPWQFAPRIGGIYKLASKTVVRAYIGVMYLPTNGDPNGYSANPSVSVTNSAQNTWHQNQFGVDPSTANWSNPYLPSQVTTATRSNQVANYQSTGTENAEGLATTMHMPHEYDINVGIQQELPRQILVEANYSGNISHSLLGPDMASEFPKNLFFPQNQSLYSTLNVPSPNWVANATSGQTQNAGLTGPTQQLALLEYSMPYFGPTQILGKNIGRSNFQSLNLRLEKRFSHGYQFLFNYQFAKALQNVGGPDDGSTGNSTAPHAALNGGGVGYTGFQTVDTIRNVYGLSPLDEKHRVSAIYLYQLPFGEGRTWLGNPSGAGGHILDGIVGGWEVSGTTVYRSGRPIKFGSVTSNVNNGFGVNVTFPSCVYQGCTGIVPANFRGGKSVLVAPGQTLNTGAVLAFDPHSLVSAAPFTYGNLPPVWDGLRNPGNLLSGLSLMKAFPIFSSDNSRYLQFRAEANNAFNIAGLGDYNTDLGAPGFGTITSVANTERHIQMSMRFVF
jgi:outer membrane receptor protein involved in Fe transport